MELQTPKDLPSIPVAPGAWPLFGHMRQFARRTRCRWSVGRHGHDVQVRSRRCSSVVDHTFVLATIWRSLRVSSTQQPL